VSITPLDDLIAIGIIRKPIGLRGFCSVEPFGGTMAALRLPCEVRIGKETECPTGMIIEEIVPMPDRYRCRFKGKDDRTAVEGLRSSLIFIEKKALPGLGPGSYYHFELEGAGVYSDRDGTRIGTVAEVHNFPSSDTLEVERDHGDPLLLPLSDQAVSAVDIAGKRITVRQSFVDELLQ
jgi:16S rRNA processing protein RimM